MTIPYSSTNNTSGSTTIITTEPVVDTTAINSTKLVTEGTLLDFVGNPNLTENSVNTYLVQPKLYGRSHSEITETGFEFIKAGVIDAEETVATYKQSSQYANHDVRLATVKATVNYVDTEITGAVQVAISLEGQYNAATYVPITNYPITYNTNTPQGNVLSTVGVNSFRIPELYFTSSRAQNMEELKMTAFKTTADEILADNINEPISCQALLESGSLAVIQGTNHASGYHSLPPSGQVIHTHLAANYVPKLTDTVIIGNGADAATESVCIGKNAGNNTAATSVGDGSVAIGTHAGRTQYFRNVAIGKDAANNYQFGGAIAIGALAGKTQGEESIALGYRAGEFFQGDFCIAIGSNAARNNQVNNSIVINATGSTLEAQTNSGFFVAPIRNVDESFTNVLRYDPFNKEIIYDTVVNSSGGGGGGGAGSNAITMEDVNNFNLANKPFPAPKTDTQEGKWHIVTVINPSDAMNNPWNGSCSAGGSDDIVGAPSIFKPLQLISNNSDGTDLVVKFEVILTNGDSHHFFYKNANLKEIFDYSRSGIGGTTNIQAFKQDSISGTIVDMPALNAAWSSPISFQTNHINGIWNWPFAASSSGTAMDFNDPNGYGLLVHGGIAGTSTQEHSTSLYAYSINSSGAGSSVEGWSQLRVYYWGA